MLTREPLSPRPDGEKRDWLLWRQGIDERLTADCPVVEDDPDRRSAEEEVEKEAESLTGLQVGGISALALINRGFDVYIDRAATELSHILVSAGCRGINLKLRVEDLIRITKARVVEATAEVDE